MSELRLALIQTDLYWEDPAANILNFRKWMQKIDPGPGMIILPETFSTGFTTNPENCAEEMTGPSVLFMMEMAQIKKSILTGSVLIREDDKYYNRCLCAFPDGRLSWYDKKHLF